MGAPAVSVDVDVIERRCRLASFLGDAFFFLLVPEDCPA